MRKFGFLYTYFFRVFDFLNLEDKTRRFYDSINRYKENKKEIMYALFLSFLFHINAIIQHFLVAQSMNLGVPLHYFFVFIPICTILLFIPISIRGFGMREILYVHLFTQVSITSAEAFSMSFLIQLLLLMGSSIGGIFYLTDPTSTKKLT